MCPVPWPPVIFESVLGFENLLHLLSIQENSVSESWSRVTHPFEHILIRVPWPLPVWAQLWICTISMSRTQGQKSLIISLGVHFSDCHLCPETKSGGCLCHWHWPCSSTWQVSGSVLSVYSGDFGSVDAQGTVEFALDYDEKNREFQVHVFQCRDLAVVDEKKGRSDPWVALWCLVTSYIDEFCVLEDFFFVCFLFLNVTVSFFLRTSGTCLLLGLS